MEDSHATINDEEENDNDINLLEVDEALSKIGTGAWQYTVFAFSFLICFSASMELTSLAILAPSLKCETSFNITPLNAGLLSSICFLAMLLGAPIWGYTSDTYGRKITLIVASIIIFVFGFLGGFMPTYFSLLITRFFVGFGLGADHVAATLLLEWLPRKYRGMWSSSLGFAWCLGAVAVSLTAWAVLPLGGWRPLLQIASIPSAVGAIGLIMAVEESPRFLASHGRVKEANKVLNLAYIKNKFSHQKKSEVNKLDFIQLKSHYHETKAQNTICEKILDLNTIGCSNLVLLMFLFFISAFCYYCVIFLATELAIVSNDGSVKCSNEGVPNLKRESYVEILVNSLAELPCALLVTWTIDCGRRINIIIGYIIAFTFILAEAIIFPNFVAASVALLFIYRAFISGAYGVVIIYSNEVVQTHVRSFSAGIFTSIGKLGSCVAPFVSQTMIQNGNGKEAIIIITASTGLGLLAMLLTTFRETAGANLDDRKNYKKINNEEGNEKIVL